MKTVDAEKFHKILGVKRQRINYQSKDFVDYVVMILMCVALIWFGYGADHIVSIVGFALCAFMIVVFPIRHGAQLKIPFIVKRPQDILYSIIHKVQNLTPHYFIALGLLLLENYIISVTPDLPHKVELAHQIALGVFWTHFIALSLYRTVILFSHLQKKDHVRQVLMESVWKSAVTNPSRVPLEIVHAYFTGLLTHIVHLVPWYLVIKFSNFSLVFLPLTFVIGILIQRSSVEKLNEWFYRDHWLGHNSEFDFIYEHGTHHDAIPSALIGVAGNGFLEGFFRGALAFPMPFFNPVIAGIFYSIDVKSDMDLHQYIPGVFPIMSKEFLGSVQHSLHHYGRLEPYSFGLNLDKPLTDEVKKQTRLLPDGIKYSYRLDEQLTGYEWDNPRFKWFLDLVDKYNDGPIVPPQENTGELDAKTPN